MRQLMLLLVLLAPVALVVGGGWVVSEARRRFWVGLAALTFAVGVGLAVWFVQDFRHADFKMKQGMVIRMAVEQLSDQYAALKKHGDEKLINEYVEGFTSNGCTILNYETNMRYHPIFFRGWDERIEKLKDCKVISR